MYCGQCGRKISEKALFCPYCGVAVPSDEEDQEDSGAQVCAAEAFVPLSEKLSEADGGDFTPLSETLLKSDEEAGAKPAPDGLYAQEALPDAEDAPRMSKPVTLSGRVPELKRRPAASMTEMKRRAYTPVKHADAQSVNVDDLFMEDDEDDFDRAMADFDKPVRKKTAPEKKRTKKRRAPRRPSRYEEEEKGTFLGRHIRGVVSLSLMVMLMVIVGFWTLSSGGQRVLAQMGVAWKASAYVELGDASYQMEAYEDAAKYYAKAMGRELRYEYAYNAGVSYYFAQDTDNAAAYLKTAIRLKSTEVNPYIYLINLYPDVATRPFEISQILEDGYAITKDERLKTV